MLLLMLLLLFCMDVVVSLFIDVTFDVVAAVDDPVAVDADVVVTIHISVANDNDVSVDVVIDVLIYW